MYQKLLLVLIITFVTITVKAQNLNFGGTANLGLSRVTSNLPIPGDYKVKFALSGNLGMFVEKRIGKKSLLGIEALWIQIEGKETTGNTELSVLNGEELEVIGIVSDESRIHSSYIGLPFYYRHEIGDIGIKGGLQTMIFLFASSNYKINGEINNEPYEGKSKMKDIQFERIDLGAKVGIDYKLSANFRLRLDYYYGMLDITSDEFPWQRKNRQISFGINYLFGTKENKK